MSNFDLKKFLTENKLTTSSRILESRNPQKNIEVINSILRDARKEMEDYLGNEEDDEAWFGMEDVEIPESISMDEYSDNMLVMSYYDRGGASVSFVYKEGYDEDEYGGETYEELSESDDCLLEIRDGVAIQK